MRRQEKARQRQQEDDDDDEEDDDFEVNEEGLVKVDDLERGCGYIKMVTLKKKPRRCAARRVAAPCSGERRRTQR